MIKKINIRTLTIILFAVLAILFFIINNFKSEQELNEISKKDKEFAELEKYLDNGMQYSELKKKNKYLSNIVIKNIKINDNKIKYTLENSSNKDVYISSQIEIKIGVESLEGKMDKIDKKIVLKSKQKKEIILNKQLDEINQMLGSSVNKSSDVKLFKPIYEEYFSPKLLGIAKKE